jgi:hypothetical protein
MAPLTQAATIANTLQGTGVAGGLGSLLFGSPAVAATGTTAAKAATSGIIPGLTGGFNNVMNSLFGGSGSGATQSGSGLGGGTTPGTYPLSGGGSMTVNADGSKVITGADGTVSNFDPQGNPSAPVLTPIPEQGLPPSTDAGNPDNPVPIDMPVQ